MRGLEKGKNKGNKEPKETTETKGMMVSEKIVEDLQKKRYELIERRTNTKNMSVQKRVMKDVVDCDNSILAVCEGRFPK